MSKSFPKNFIWGAATAAFQIEGHPDEYSQKLSDWSKWIDREDKVLKPTNEGQAVRHFDHLEEDIKLMKKLKLKAYRFSFNWAALHRGPGEFDLKTLDFYKKLIDKLLDDSEGAAIEPFPTLIHFVLPEWLAKEGGWENPQTAYEFENYTKFLLEHFGSKITNWTTHNEPNIFLWFGYESGIWPPGHQNDFNRYLKAYQGLLLGHQLAYKAIKESNSKAKIGFAQNLYAFQTKAELEEAKLSDELFKDSSSVPMAIRKQLHNYMFIESCAEINALDFLGINYYTRFAYDFNTQAKDSADTNMDSLVWAALENPSAKHHKEVNDLNWEIYPDGLKQVLVDQKLKNIIADIPIYITENGYSCLETKRNKADINDDYRISFIQKHLNAVHEAIDEGTNVQGYFYWSLLDNFEWALGMEPRFGLIHVDHKSFKRTPKDSYHYYQKICETNSL